MDMPEDLRSITAEWLTEALGIGMLGDDAAVTSFSMERVGEEQGWIGEVARIELSYSEPLEGMPSSLVAKFSPHDSRRVFSLHEVPFYHEIAAGNDFAVPACYYGEADPRTGGSVLLLEDLCRMRIVSFVEGCTPGDAEAAVEALAKVHIRWWNDPMLENMDWLFTIADTRFGEWWSHYPEEVGAILPDFELSRRLLEFGNRFAADMPLILDRIEGAPYTCIHRDSHVDNLLFGSHVDDSPVVLVDWQTAGRGKGVSDVAYLLISSLDPADRRACERRLVDMYHRRLIASGVDDYTFEECWSDYVVGAASKMFITVTATVHFDNTSAHRRAWRRADLQRLTAFIDDHDPINEL